MLNELLFTLFFTHVGIVAIITACIVGVVYLFYAEIITLNEYNADKPLEAPAGPLDECEQGIHLISRIE